MATYAENREYTRTPIHARTEIRLGNGIVVEGDAVDASLRGLMFMTENRLPIGKSVRVVLIVESGMEPQRINAGGQIARLHNEGVAVKFTEMDRDNAQHLNEVLSSNAPRAARATAAGRKN